MEKFIYKGKNEEEILKSALSELNVSINEIIYKSSEEKGSLFQGKKIKLEITKVEDLSNLGKQILENLLTGIGLEGNIEKKIREKQISYNIHSNNNGLLIGKKGKVLEYIETFIKHSIHSQTGFYVNIIIDIEDYKEKQNYFFIKDIKKIAREVTLSKVPVKLDPMNSYQRRMIHNALSKFDYIETESEGIEPNRYVVIKYKEK